ncbi:cohesin domain-containing protein [Paenibacillus antarcticus]|uniref:Dockerin domain-containing protein n=1 Tax=Paenibacillus antarcticus TaxID=253703 RepID=A0A162MBR7_9BACL|nr:cohesin domain-containing protein [Paenibacillus antarcticus]OAB46855.1 hypothetical protein PBAT_09330 [Paenibacillus antarcticus]
MRTNKLIASFTLAFTLMIGSIGLLESNSAQAADVDLPIRYSQNFEDNSLGGWEHTTGTGSMAIVNAPANATEHALQLTANSTNNVFIDQNSPSIKDGEIEFKITPKSTVIREGIIFRYASATSWASMGFDGSGWYWVNAQDQWGEVTKNVGAALQKDVTSTVKVKYEGSKITLYVNGTSYFEGTLANLPTGAGKMGARVFGTSIAAFDDINYANNVSEVSVSGVTLDKESISLAIGESTELVGTVLPANATNKKVTWVSSDTSVATVEIVNGKANVTAIAAGSANITVTTEVGSFTAVSMVTVVAPTSEVLSTTLTAPSTVKYGEEFTVKFGFENVAETVYAQDITIQYNANLMEFVSADSLVNGVAIMETKNSPGSLRLILASQGELHGISGDAEVASLTFKAKQGDQPTSGAITVVKASIGDGNGVETDAATSSVEIAFESVPVELSPDINGDGKVSIGDLAVVAANYGKTNTDSDWNQVKRSDVNGDGKIDINDLALIAQKILE